MGTFFCVVLSKHVVPAHSIIMCEVGKFEVEMVLPCLQKPDASICSALFIVKILSDSLAVSPFLSQTWEWHIC